MDLVQQEGENMNIDIICAMIVLVIATTISVIIFLVFDHKFEKGFREGYTKGRTEQNHQSYEKLYKYQSYEKLYKYKIQNIVVRYEQIENNCREQSQRADISEKQRDYLRLRANCYKDIINDLKKGIDDGIS